MIPRRLEPKLRELARYYPVVAVTGPRQSGKTTLCKKVFPKKAYVSLEALDVRDYARTDPRGFFTEYKKGAIIDEVQHVPELLSYLQGEVDNQPESGRFILTGSQHFGLSQSIAQSLAGRCGILVLLPLSLDELSQFKTSPDELYQVLWQGAYPRIYDRKIPPHQWLADYVTTYIQRDVRQLVNVSDLQAFSGFLKLCAGRTAQELNASKLSNDAGVSHNTVRAWLSVLEASYIIHRLPAWCTNVRKQVVKAPKIHFIDSGLACYLLGITEPQQLRHHPQRGAIFESWVVSELFKNLVHRGKPANLFHYREARGLEIDLIIEAGQQLHAVEIKSAETIASDAFTNLQRFIHRLTETKDSRTLTSTLIYGGEESQRRTHAKVTSWRQVNSLKI